MKINGQSAEDDSVAQTTRYLIKVSYDGTEYAGWQWQLNSTTVQEKIEIAIKEIFNTSLRIHGCSRTDTGVHAIGMMAHLDLPNRNGKAPMPSEKLPLALNRALPQDIRIVSSKIVPSSFHARFAARGKQYRYFIWNDRHANPHLLKSAWHFPRPHDLGLMREASKLIKGKRDFRAFANNHTYEIENTVRTLNRCSIRRTGPLVTIILEGDGFLYKMCRGITGTLAQVGIKKYKPIEIKKMLESKNRSLTGMTAPPHGLFLWKVFY